MRILFLSILSIISWLGFFLPFPLKTVCLRLTCQINLNTAQQMILFEKTIKRHLQEKTARENFEIFIYDAVFY